LKLLLIYIWLSKKKDILEKQNAFVAIFIFIFYSSDR